MEPNPNQKIITTHPTSVNSSIIRSVISNLAVPKMLSFKLIKPKTVALTPVTSTTDSTQYLTTTTTVPLNSLLNVSSPSRIHSQAVLHENSSATSPLTSSIQQVPSLDSSTIYIDSDNEKENNSAFNKDDNFIWDHKTIILFFSEYEEHQKKLQEKKYKSKEAMFHAIAESFQKRGYRTATKNNIKNKFKLVKKKWDKYIKRTIGKNSSGKGMKSLPYENEMTKLFGRSHSGTPAFVVGRNEMISQQEILQNVGLNLPENGNEEQSSIVSNLPLSTLTVNSESQSIADNSSLSITDSSCSSLVNSKAKVRDGKLALTVQFVKDSICAMLQNESKAKQETRTQYLTELQKCNELQKERNNILQKQLKVLERMEKTLYKNMSEVYPTQKESSSEEEL